MREFARQLFRLDGSRLAESGNPGALPARVSRICRSRILRAAGFETLRSLGIERAHTIIGPSLGGMVGARLCGAVSARDARGVISISGTAAASPFAIALRSIQREAILRDPDWSGGAYTDERPPATGMRIARKLGMMTYRSAAEWVRALRALTGPR